MNKIILLGRVGKEIDLRYTQDGKPIANFSLAVNDGYGEQKKTMWINIVAWQKNAENCATYLKKGSQILVEGKLQIREYEKDGLKKQITEVIMNTVYFLEKVVKKENSGELNLDDLEF